MPESRRAFKRHSRCVARVAPCIHGRESLALRWTSRSWPRFVGRYIDAAKRSARCTYKVDVHVANGTAPSEDELRARSNARFQLLSALTRVPSSTDTAQVCRVLREEAISNSRCLRAHSPRRRRAVRMAYAPPFGAALQVAPALHGGLWLQTISMETGPMRFYISTTHGDDRNPGNTLLPWCTEDHARRQVNDRS